MEPIEHSTRRLERLAALAATIVLLGFLAASIALARVNRSPGSSDSCLNLTLARSLAGGRGYRTGALAWLWVRESLDAQDTARPPGVPYLLAIPFAIAGVSLAVPVLVNAGAVLLNALALRGAIRRRGGRSAGDLALILVLLSTNYEMVSIWNNNILAACASMLLLVASRRDEAGRTTARLPVWLAVWSAIGFLMKQSFVLMACPFALVVLTTDSTRSKARRVGRLAVFGTLFLALTAVYWGRNLVLHGTLLHLPWLSSIRLASRYEFLPHGLYRSLRFDRPATYGEVLRTLGPARMGLIEVKMVAKTLFYTVCMNPAVALVAAASVVFGQPARGRDYARVGALGAGLLFEVGIYYHHEFRYLWPLYPCLIFLAWLTVRDFEAWSAGELGATLRARFQAAFVLVGASALLIGALGGLENWWHAFEEARWPPPAWVDAVRTLPPSSVVLTSDVGPVVWWTGRRALVSPLGSRADLATVVAAYKAGYFLASGPDDHIGDDVAFTPSDLVPIDRGEGWGLYRIVGPIADGEARAARRIAPEHLPRAVPAR